jgi:hypothetical protein
MVTTTVTLDNITAWTLELDRGRRQAEWEIIPRGSSKKAKSMKHEEI